MAASTTRNRMTRPESARPVQTNGREVVSVGVFDAATWNMFKLRSQGKSSHRSDLLAAHRGDRRLDIDPQRLEDMAQTNGREVVSVGVFDAATWNMFKLRSQE